MGLFSVLLLFNGSALSMHPLIFRHWEKFPKSVAKIAYRRDQGVSGGIGLSFNIEIYFAICVTLIGKQPSDRVQRIFKG